MIRSSAEVLTKELRHLNLPCDFWAARWFHETTSTRAIRNEKPDRNHTFHDAGYMIEVMVDGHMGYAGSSDFSPEGIRRTAFNALELSKRFSKLKIHHFDSSVRPAHEGNYQSPFETPLDHASVGSIVDVLMQASRSMNIHSDISNRFCSAMIFKTEIIYTSSAGAQIQQNFQSIMTDMKSTATRANESQSRSDHGLSARTYQIGAEYFRAEDFRTRAEKISEEALELLSAPNCPTETTDLILAPDQMLLQIHESIGHPLELDRILGDERNYAGWSFVQLKDFGNLKYGSPLMNVTFDPTVKGQLASYKFDDSGHRAQKECLIRNGILERGLGSLESQARAQVPGVANFRATSWNRAPIDRMANINLEPGNESVESLIGRVQKGILMCSNTSWSIDDYRNKFQFGCEYAREIRDGKLGRVLKNPNYRGSTLHFWGALDGLSDSKSTQYFGTPYCGKGEPNQAIKVGHRSPFCLFRNIEVFGGGH
jgi:predicted Zn-dependent protease